MSSLNEHKRKVNENSSLTRITSTLTADAELFHRVICKCTHTSKRILFLLRPSEAAMLPFLSKQTLELFGREDVFKELLRTTFPYANTPRDNSGSALS